MTEIIKNNEQVHKAEKEIKYLFFEGEDSDKLIVTFPGFTNAGRFEYRYVRTLKDVNAHRIFVLDNFGFRGCYLIGQNRDFSVQKAVMSLINTYLEKYDLKMENVILHGSSKGGWMALYYGIKYGFGHVITGGPQIRLGDFLVHNEFDTSLLKVADFISGGHEEDDVEYLNSLLYDLLSSSEKFPHIYIHVGEGDFHYEKHIKPFINELDKRNIDYQLDIQEYEIHNALALYYPEYLLETISNIDNKMFNNDIYRFKEKVELDKYYNSPDIEIRINHIFELYGSTISFKGWAFLKNENCESYERYLIIEMEDGIEKYNIISEPRPEVVRVFEDNSNYLYSGFTCRVNRDSLDNKFKLGMLFKSKENEDKQYYKKLDQNFTIKQRRLNKVWNIVSGIKNSTIKKIKQIKPIINNRIFCYLIQT